MNRFVAILFCVMLFGLVVVTASTTPVHGRADFIWMMVWVHYISQFILLFGLLFYCGFAALHAVQRIDCPLERSMWVILTIGLNVLGSCYYYCTTYQKFRSEGLGSLINRNELTKK